MAITHYLRLNNNTTDAISGSWTVNGTVTSQPTQWIAGNYYFNTGNLYLTETVTLNYCTILWFWKNRSTSDSDGKLCDMRSVSNYCILLWTPSTNTISTTWNWTYASYVHWSRTTRKHIATRFDWSTIKLYVDGIERASSSVSWTMQYTSIRLGQENAGAPNRRFLWDWDEIRIDNSSLSVAWIRNHRIFFLWYF